MLPFTSRIPGQWGRVSLLAAVGMTLAAPNAGADQRDLRADFTAARNWAYVLQGLDADMFAQLRSLAVDIVVVDDVGLLNEWNHTGVDVAAEVAALKATPGPTLPRKIVLAYVDVGQAEEHRTYWQDGWAPGSPDWIVGTDPDGWVGNYPIAYWRDEWRAIMQAAVQQVATEGYDGIYMDWVEAYSDESVVSAAQAAGVDPASEMANFVLDIGTWGRAVNPDFLVIAQNAAEIIDEVPSYTGAIDGLAQEQLHYDGSPDEGGLPGDCPLPRTDADIDSPEFLASLPDPSCQGLSTLQVSTEWYLGYLRPILASGVKVMVIDYAVVPANVEDAFQRSLAEGFVPYAGPRQLDRIGSILEVVPTGTATGASLSTGRGRTRERLPFPDRPKRPTANR